MKNNYLAGVLFVLAGVLLLVWTIDGKVSFFQWTAGEREILESQQFDLAIAELDIQTSSTDVIFRQSSDDTLKLEVHGYPAQQAHYRLEVKEHDDKLVIAYEDSNRLNWFSFQRGHRLVVELPDKAFQRMEAQSSSGDIVAETELLANEVRMETSSGDVILEAVQTDKLAVKSSSGDLSAHANIEAGQADWKTSSGNIELRGMRAQAVTIASQSGNVELGDMSAASMTINGSSGNVEVETCACHLEVSLSSGDVEFHALTGAGKVKVSSGTVHMMNWEVTGDSSVGATSGNVDISLIHPEALALELKVSSGNMRVQLPDMAIIEQTEKRLKGQYGSGGPTLAVQTSSGNIRID